MNNRISNTNGRGCGLTSRAAKPRPAFVEAFALVAFLTLITLMALFAALAARPAHAADTQPLDMVRAIYAPFLGRAAPTADLDLLAAHAAPELLALLEREADCQKTDNFCKYDFSVIVDGQDSKISDLQLQLAAPTRETQEITATFLNFGRPSRVVYLYRNSDAGWLLEDVQSREEHPWSLRELLR